MADHAKYPPSSMSRLISCPASHQEQLLAPPQRTSEYAAKGTMLHEQIAMMLEGNKNALGNEPTHEEFNWLHEAYAYAQTITEGDIYKVEVRGSLKPWGINHVWGTADLVIAVGDTLHVVDWKFGQGVQVYANKNPQLMTYAAIATGYPSNYTKFVIHIAQPPLGHYDTYAFDIYELEEFIFKTIVNAIEQATITTPSYGPSEDACRFCNASMTCKAHFNWAQTAYTELFKEVNKPLHGVQTAELVRLFDLTERVVKYRSEIAKYLVNLCLDGQSVPGKRIVAGRGSRAWDSTKELILFLEDEGISSSDFYTSKIISPAQAEKLYPEFKKDECFQSLINKVQGKPNLVDADDKRPDYLDTKDLFKGVE